MLAMPVVWDERCRLHDPAGEVFVGVRTPGTEVRGRLDAITTALTDARLVAAEPHDDEVLLDVHDEALVDFLSTAWENWDASRVRADPGQDRVVPYVFAHVGLASRPLAIPAAVWARTGYFAYDTMTLIGPGTWEAARAAIDVALTAADLVASGAQQRVRVLPSARSPCVPFLLRRLLLPQQFRRRRRVACPSRREGRRARHRRAPRERDAGGVLGTR
jgi:acetoin utilization deacetylase AcuC-like enzyme